jgi:acetyl-CoA acetyltransferase
MERHNAFPEDPIQLRGGWADQDRGLLGWPGAGPEDMDLLQTYDDYPVISMMQIEDLGFCEKGAGGDFVRDPRSDGDRRFPAQHVGRAACRSVRRARQGAIWGWSRRCGR